jgi:hypothetical protein
LQKAGLVAKGWTDQHRAKGIENVGTVEFGPGGYRYVSGVFQYSAGVAAAEGHEIVRATFNRPVPLAEGFDRIAGYLEAAGRPRTAFCACELRSPAPFSEDGFRTFNERYVSVLESWGLTRHGANPVARTNVCPALSPPAEPVFHAFCYTTPSRSKRPTFVVSGSGEVPEGRSNYADHIVRPGDTSIDGIRDKAAFVLATMESRLQSLGVTWDDVTGTQIYTIHDIHPHLAELFVKRGAARFGVTWHLTRPPVAGLDFEMDCRGLATELMV